MNTNTAPVNAPTDKPAHKVNIVESITQAMLMNATRLLGEKEALEADMSADIAAFELAQKNLSGKREKLAAIIGEIRQNGIPSVSSAYLPANEAKATKTGRVVSEETKAKMAASHKASWAAKKAAATSETPVAEPVSGL